MKQYVVWYNCDSRTVAELALKKLGISIVQCDEEIDHVLEEKRMFIIEFDGNIVDLKAKLFDARMFYRADETGTYSLH